jgi:uncharacterized SAM-binding protein YcdF (DUF218 family)
MGLFRLPLMALLFLALLVAFVLGANAFVQVDDLKQCNMTPTDGQCVAADAVVAISGGNTTSRAEEAVALYKNGWTKTLIFSGAALDPESPSNAEVMKKQAVSEGVPAEAILLDTTSNNTPENADNIRLVAQKHNIHSIILVTSPYHQARASVLFKKVFNNYGYVRNHPTSTDTSWSSYWWLQPYNWYLVLTEMIKTIPALVG